MAHSKGKIGNDLIDKVGMRFGKLLVTECIEPSDGKHYGEGNNRGRWLCICDCGNVIEMQGYRLTEGKGAKSCGCVQKQKATDLCISKRAPEKVTYTAQYLSHKGSAIKRGYIPISKDEWKEIVTQPCHYCGEIDIRNNFSGKFDLYRNKQYKVDYNDELIKSYEVPCNGVDRIDSKKGYEADNCVPCCAQCNYMKTEYTQEQFFDKVQLIYNKHFSNSEYSNLSIDSFICT